MNEANLNLVNKLVDAWGVEKAEAYIAETLRVQRFTKSEVLIRVWETNLRIVQGMNK